MLRAQPPTEHSWSRREVAHWAQEYLSGGLPFERFLELVPEDTDDEDIAELLMLVKHEPKPGGLVGARPGEHDRHMARIRQLIEILGS